jgi:hypothetical protein
MKSLAVWSATFILYQAVQSTTVSKIGDWFKRMNEYVGQLFSALAYPRFTGVVTTEGDRREVELLWGRMAESFGN